MKKILFGLLFLTLLSACGEKENPIDLPALEAEYAQFVQRIKTNEAAQLATDDAILKKYLADNKLTAQVTPEGIYYIIETEGKDGFPNLISTVKTNYRGYRVDGFEFDKSKSPIDFGLLDVIPGWTIGLQKFKAGSKGKLLIPSPFAYGKRAQGANIPANSPLIFDVELISFK